MARASIPARRPINLSNKLIGVSAASPPKKLEIPSKIALPTLAAAPKTPPIELPARAAVNANQLPAIAKIPPAMGSMFSIPISSLNRFKASIIELTGYMIASVKFFEIALKSGNLLKIQATTHIVPAIKIIPSAPNPIAAAPPPDFAINPIIMNGMANTPIAIPADIAHSIGGALYSSGNNENIHAVAKIVPAIAITESTPAITNFVILPALLTINPIRAKAVPNPNMAKPAFKDQALEGALYSSGNSENIHAVAVIAPAIAAIPKAIIPNCFGFLLLILPRVAKTAKGIENIKIAKPALAAHNSGGELKSSSPGIIVNTLAVKSIPKAITGIARAIINKSFAFNFLIAFAILANAKEKENKIRLALITHPISGNVAYSLGKSLKA